MLEEETKQNHKRAAQPRWMSAEETPLKAPNAWIEFIFKTKKTGCQWRTNFLNFMGSNFWLHMHKHLLALLGSIL
jgi:hypothetical protein